MSARMSAAGDGAEGNVEDRVGLPVREIEVPPLVRFDGEALAFHCPAKNVAKTPRLGAAAGKARVGAWRHFVVSARHLDLASRREIVEREVHGASAIVLRALRGIGNEFTLVRWRHVPEQLRHPPGAIAVE